LGEKLAMSLRIDSIAAAPQRLVIDYAIHYVKKSGGTSAKVFKWKEVTLAAGDSLSLSRAQSIRDFTTRAHYSGKHSVDLIVNGQRAAEGSFLLRCA
jgi:hypothetical protein